MVINMNNPLIRSKELGFSSLQDFHSEAFKRSIGFISKAELAELRYKKVGIPGLGGVGGSHLTTLIRSGFCNFNIADLDIFEPHNANRQYGAKISNYNRPKVDVMIEESKEINPYVNFTTFPDGINESNMEEFLDGLDILIDGLDVFVVDIRIKLFQKALEKGIPIITAGPLGFGSSLVSFSPTEGSSFKDYTGIHKDMSDQDKFLNFVASVAPKPLHTKYMLPNAIQIKQKKVPSLGIGCQMASALMATQALKICLNRKGVRHAPYFLTMDPYEGKIIKSKLVFGHKNPLQKMKISLIKKFIKNNEQFKDEAPKIPNISNEKEPISDAEFRYIIKAGTRAPSGENKQPWKFKQKQNQVNIYLDKNADKSFFNLDQKGSYLALGAVLENMKIAASQFHLGTKIEFLRNANEELYATVSFERASISTNFLSREIWERCVNRKPYIKKALAKHVIPNLQEQLEGFEGAKLHTLEDQRQIKKLQKISEFFAKIRIETKSIHEFLHSNIHQSNEVASQIKTGFPIDNLEAGKMGNLMLKSTKEWSVTSTLNKIGFSKLVAKKTEEGFGKCSACFLLSVPDRSDSSFIKGGQALQRLWLSLSHNGIAMQPMTTINFFHYRYITEGLKNFNPKYHKKMLHEFENFQKLFPKLDMKNNGQIMLMRVGYAPEIKTWTTRQNVEDFLI